MKNFLFFGLLILLTTSCSRTGVMFRFFDTLAVSKTDDYFDLSSEQHDTLKKDLQKDLETLRREFFPVIAKNLRELAPLTHQEKINQEVVLKKYLELHHQMKLFTAYFKDTSIKTALSLRPSQLEYFAKEVRKEIAKNTDPEDQQEMAYTRYRRSIEFWMGGINSAQKEKIKHFLTTHPYPAKLQNDSKNYVLEKFLLAGQNRDDLKKFVTDFISDFELVRLPTFTQSLNEHKQAFQNFFANDFWPSLTEVQRKHLRESLLARAEELDELAQRP